MDIEIELTTNHYGWFELKLCPTNDKLKLETQECMDAHPLYLVNDPSKYRFNIPRPEGKPSISAATFNYQVQLPPGLTCSQCVVQWTYRAGNLLFTYLQFAI
jgi:hypothetical protein